MSVFLFNHALKKQTQSTAESAGVKLGWFSFNLLLVSVDFPNVFNITAAPVALL